LSLFSEWTLFAFRPSFPLALDDFFPQHCIPSPPLAWLLRHSFLPLDRSSPILRIWSRHGLLIYIYRRPTGLMQSLCLKCALCTRFDCLASLQCPSLKGASRHNPTYVGEESFAEAESNVVVDFGRFSTSSRATVTLSFVSLALLHQLSKLRHQG
jgi:hypothetical protein